MDFCDFVQMMHSVIYKDQKKSTFLLNLITLFIAGSELDGENDDNNPLKNLKENSLDKIYNGKAQLSRNAAKKIRERLDKEKFINNLEKLWPENDDDYNVLVKKYPNEKDVLIRCANIFEEIINRIADTKRKNIKDDEDEKWAYNYFSSRFKPLIPQICQNCTKWKGYEEKSNISNKVVLGKCSALNKDTLTYDGEECEMFEGDYFFSFYYYIIKEFNELKNDLDT